MWLERYSFGFTEAIVINIVLFGSLENAWVKDNNHVICEISSCLGGGRTLKECLYCVSAYVYT